MKKNASRLGGKIALVTVSIGLLIAVALLIMISPGGENGSVFDGIKSILLDYPVVSLIGIFSIYFFGWIFGSQAGKKIIIDKRESGSIGIFTGAKILLSTIFLCSLTNFFNEGIENSNFLYGLFDYIINPIMSIGIFSIIPIIIIGVFFGRFVKYQGKFLEEASFIENREENDLTEHLIPPRDKKE
jgi:hypothetical protein